MAYAKAAGGHGATGKASIFGLFKRGGVYGHYSGRHLRRFNGGDHKALLQQLRVWYHFRINMP
ncbi:MAG: hypothetical protein OJF51_005019 [Nitrospira sp.]|nr:MAG: hypothetical protein OJF51_005019 [Nitrospira sp.]